MAVQSRPMTGTSTAAATTDLVADPAGQVFRSIAVNRCLGLVARAGLLAELGGAPVELDVLARRFGLLREPLRLILDVLVNEHLLENTADGYRIAPAARARLDPDSPGSVVTLLSHTLDFWSLWADLGFVARGGQAPGGVPAEDDDAAWQRRIRGRYEYARRVGDRFLDTIELPPGDSTMIDVGGSHGWFSEALCRRNPLLRSTVIDTEAAIAVGRELAWEAGLEDSITHVAGDIFTTDFGGPHDIAVCLPLQQGLDHQQTMTLLTRIRAALRPGGLLVTLRANPDDQPVPGGTAAAALQLFLHLDSGITPVPAARFFDQLSSAGFAPPAPRRVPSATEVCLFVARAI